MEPEQREEIGRELEMPRERAARLVLGREREILAPVEEPEILGRQLGQAHVRAHAVAIGSAVLLVPDTIETARPDLDASERRLDVRADRPEVRAESRQRGPEIATLPPVERDGLADPDDAAQL